MSACIFDRWQTPALMPQQPLESRPETCPGQAAPRQRYLRWLLCLTLLALISGCGGCGESTPTPEQTEREKAEQEKAEQAKAEFLLGNLRSEPNGLEPRRVGGTPVPVKPGHWTSATIEALSNREALSGEIRTSPLPLSEMDYSLSALRGATLAKGEAKQLEFMFFPPEGRKETSFGLQLATAAGRNLVTLTERELVQLPAHQFFFLVLATDPDRYSYLRTLDSVRAPTGNSLLVDYDMHYRVLLPHVRLRVPLPATALTWSSLAYLLWDRFDPSQLTPAQTQALLDWLHWGGQIIISGPDTLDVLAAGFLKPYVPADPGGTGLWTADQLAELSVRDWSMPGPELADDRQWTGVELQPRADAEVLVSTDDRPLVVERRIGRGRIVVTAFSLTERELRKWPEFDTLVNACLLRRPARKITATPPESSGSSDEPPELIWDVTWLDGNDNDATRTSAVRIFSRDAVADLGSSPWHQFGLRRAVAEDSTLAGLTSEEREYVGPGVAGWNNQSDVALAAQASLRAAAGIVIPDATFVVQILALYLAVLVPLNWAVFRLIGRVELAWIAVPVLSILFTVLVVRWAQLDIGFARAEADYAVVELFEGYDRAHVTHYTALYTSLATRFAAVFEGAAVAQPLPVEQSLLGGFVRDQLVLRQGETTRLEGFEVASNTTGLLHSEQFRDVGGALRLARAAAGGWQVVNETDLTLHGAGVLGPEGAAWIGELAPGEGAVLEFVSYSSAALWHEEREKLPQTASSAPEEILSVRRMLDMAVEDYDESSEALRLIAWSEAGPGGITIEPATSQRREIALVVAHLRPAPLDEPQNDQGTPRIAGEPKAEPQADSPDSATPKPDDDTMPADATTDEPTNEVESDSEATSDAEPSEATPEQQP